MLNTDQEYRLHIKEVGKYNLKDTYKWKEKAILFQERGYYTDYVEDTHDWLDFWEKEEEKILNGTYIDGWYIPGLYYFYLNYLPIFRKQDNIYDFPDVYDSDYHTYLCLEHAVFLNQDFCVIKKRQCIDKETFINLPNGVETIENLFLKNYRGEIFSLDENKELCIDKVKDIWVAKKVTEIIRITLAGGKSIECTEDHKINTTEGWKKASELKLKDSLYTIEPPFGDISISENEAIVTDYIKKIERIKKDTITYDLATENTQSFFANGIHVHNSGFSLKFCVPLIRELFFSRGSPNYIATYEEAQVLKAWSEIIEPYKEHLNTHTPWYRDLNPSKPLNWRTAKEVINESGRKLTVGRKNTLKGLVLSKSPSKGVGGSAKWIFADESGVNPVLSTFKGYISPMIKYGNVKTGTLIISGAVGELKHLEGGLKEYITYPEKNGFYAVDNIWDKNNEFAGKKCGFFVPESWAYFGKDDDPESEFFGQPFIDEHGNSFVERATEYILKQRNGLVPNSIVEASKFDISQAPLTLSECFQYRGENVFPLELLNPQIERVERKEIHGTYIDLYEDQNKQIKKTILDKYSNRPILNHPIDPKSKNKEGVIQVWEMPPAIRPPYGVYWAGVDIVRDSESVNSPSLNCIHIYKGSHELEGEYKEKIIVAKYMSRPKDKMEWFNKAILLMEWYNAEALVENNVNWFIEEAIKIKKQHKIAKTPQWAKDLTPQGTSYLTKPYGVVMTPALLNKLLDAIAKYIKEPIFTEYNEEDGRPFIHYGVERINDLQLLRELVNYKPKKEYEKGNYDSCFLKGTKITTPTGYKNIEDFKIGDYVINHKGLNDTVIETHKNYYKGDLYEITIPNQFNKIYCTEEHPILTSKRHYRTSGRWWYKFRNNMQDIGFKEAKNITKEDYIFLPKKKELKKNNKLSNIYESFNNIIPNKKNIRNVFIETDDGCWLKIKNIKKSYYEGYVYNIGVEKENTYIAENIAVHNCISFGLALLHAEFNEVRGITAKSVPEKPNFNKKNAKLLMRNRFSSRNFKLNK